MTLVQVTIHGFTDVPNAPTMAIMRSAHLSDAPDMRTIAAREPVTREIFMT
jgi:RNA 3'-terminal phosphate cyclase